MDGAEHKARNANSPGLWDGIWRTEGTDTWRARAMARVYARIAELVRPQWDVLELGGGVGALAAVLRGAGHKGEYVLLDHSAVALAAAGGRDLGVVTLQADLEVDLHENLVDAEEPFDCVLATEVLEHLSQPARDRAVRGAVAQGAGLFSVPHDRLGPDEEPQHAIRWTAMEFLEYLRSFGAPARVEIIDGYMLGVVGTPAYKPYRLSVALPVRDEAHDLGATLASFRGVADEMVVGVDPRTTDATREVAARYAEVVFGLEQPQGPNAEYQGPDGVHFSWCRNQCIDWCTGDWVFMTEGHERLAAGQEVLLKLDEVLQEHHRIALVARTSNRQRWFFPWLFRNDDRIRFERPVHNSLKYPPKWPAVWMPQVITYHERHQHQTVARAKQRKGQNRKRLFDDWLQRSSDHSLFYLAQEWRGQKGGKHRAIERYEQYLKVGRSAQQRYQARLVLAKEYMEKQRMKDAKHVLLGAVSDDWSRCEHWLWLGDLAFVAEQLEEALKYYLYAAVHIGAPPWTLWWIDLDHYGHLPAQRLAMTYAALGRLDEALAWAHRVAHLLPDDAPAEAHQEAHDIIRRIEEWKTSSSA